MARHTAVADHYRPKVHAAYKQLPKDGAAVSPADTGKLASVLAALRTDAWVAGVRSAADGPGGDKIADSQAQVDLGAPDDWKPGWAAAADLSAVTIPAALQKLLDDCGPLADNIAGYQDGTDVDLSDQVDRLVNTKAADAATHGTFGAYQAAGIGQWNSVPDAHACQACLSVADGNPYGPDDGGPPYHDECGCETEPADDEDRSHRARRGGDQVDPCNRCDGTKTVELNGQQVTCPQCEGSGTGENNAADRAAHWADAELRAKYTQEEIDELGKKGQAFGPDDAGHYSYPIADEADLGRAIKAVGRGNMDHDKLRKYIIGRAKALGASDQIPDSWNADGSLKQANARPSRSVEWRKRKAQELRGAERRTRLERVEIREAADGQLHLTGYASVTSTPYDMGWYSEQIGQGAFRKTLSEDPDVQLLINHAGLPLARTKSGTLQLTEDNIGLRVDADLDPEDPDVQSLSRKMARGDIDQMSFAFRATRQSWNEDYTERTITECDIHRGDVSVVNQGANPATMTSIRCDDSIRALRHLGAVGVVEAWLEHRVGVPADDELELLGHLATIAAADDADHDEVRQLLAARATPKAADAKVMDALNAMASACAEAIAAQSKDPDNNTDPVDAKVWEALKGLQQQIVEAIALQAKDGSPDAPAEDDDDAGSGGAGDDPADDEQLGLPNHGLEVRLALERLRHAPRRIPA